MAVRRTKFVIAALKSNFILQILHGTFQQVQAKIVHVDSEVASTYVERQDQWNGPLFFFLKSHISAPDDTNSTIVFPVAVYPLYFHVITDLGHI